MIVYFPELYPDELLYSLFSRYYEKSGCLAYVLVAEELFENPKERLDFIFTNKLKPSIIRLLSKNTSWEQILMRHTLFPYYSRFLSADRKKIAFEKLKAMDGDYTNLLSLTPNRSEKADYLRYCPLCAAEHRKKYGETYWSRIHQIPEIKVCPIHGCKLLDSTVVKDRHKTRYFRSAESEIENVSVEYSSKVESAIAKYLYEILSAKVCIEKNIQAGKFLISKLANTKYLSSRGQIINVGLLHQDLRIYYGNSDVGIQKEWQLSKVLHGERINPYEIAQIGLFLNITATDLIKGIPPDKAVEELFDEKVLDMIKNGMSIYKVADKLNVSQALIHLIIKNHGIQSSKHDRYTTNKLGDREKRIEEEREFWLSAVKKYPSSSYTQLCEIPEYKLRLRWLRRNDKEWTDEHFPKITKSHTKLEKLSTLDEKYYPEMEQIIKQHREKDDGNPRRITVNAISLFMGFKGGELYNMPKCRAVIEKHSESWEEYWARKCIWAADIINSQGMVFDWKCLNSLTHIKKKSILKSIPFIEKLDFDLAQQIKDMLL